MEIETKNSLHPLLLDLQEQQYQLFSYAKSKEITHESIHKVLGDTCERISNTMECERVSIWLFDDHKERLVSQYIFDSSVGHGTVTKTLLQSTKPIYFNTIQTNRILAVEDIESNPMTQELLGDYFESGACVKSMVDVTIILSEGIGGVVCCETSKKRSWSPLEKIVLTSIADMLSYLFDRLYRLKVEERVHALAYTDTLTGLDNQNSFNDKVASKIKHATPDEKGVFVYLWLDQYTEIESVLGQTGGEELLKEVAKRLLFLFPTPAVTARIGFDHFVIYFPFTKNRPERELDLESIANELKRPMEILGQETFLTFSYGMSYFPRHAKTVREGIRTARLALESVRKHSSRKSRGVYKPSMHSDMEKVMSSEINLRRGLDMNEFRLHYQPQVDAQTGELKGFEALIRWQHPQKGLMFPIDFIELAESTGLIVPIGEWVIAEAFAQLKKWKDQGFEHLTLSINLSPRHFLHPKLLVYMTRLLAETGVAANRLVLEITENVALGNHELIKERINSLKVIGFTVSIDDFGTGYAAFMYLQHFSISEIKIDRQFINAISDDPKSEVVIKTIIHLGKMLELRTIAEGVETIEQWERLKELGCCQIQGYYFSKPLPIEELNRLLTEQPTSQKIFLPWLKK
jgi:diguanylate cyclase (GGDEF)-like protein